LNNPNKTSNTNRLCYPKATPEVFSSTTPALQRRVVPLIATVKIRFSPPRTQRHDKRYKYSLPAACGLVNLLVTAVQVPTNSYFYPGRVGAG